MWRIRAWLIASFVILIWGGVTFVNTRALLGDFSALEILVVRFALAWTSLWAVEPRKFVKKCRADEWLFAALFLGERLTPMSTLGGVVIIVGVAIANWRKK